MWVVYALLVIFVLLTRERTLLDPTSFLHQRYAPIGWLMVLHGVPGAVALVLGVFQFSTRLRSRYLEVHRWMGRAYVWSVFIATPAAIAVGYALSAGAMMLAVVFHSFAWLSTTAIALYAVRNGNIQQHREWMIRSYPFAMVFILVRAVNGIPAIHRMGEPVLNGVVWTMLALAALLPSFAIEWRSVTRKKNPSQTMGAAAAD